MVGVNVIAAETDGEARRLATTQQMSFANIFRGARGLSQPPIDDIETYWTPAEKAQAKRMLARSIVGSPETVREGIEALVAETRADELIVVSDVYDHAARLRSFELIAEAAEAATVQGGIAEPARSATYEMRTSSGDRTPRPLVGRDRVGARADLAVSGRGYRRNLARPPSSILPHKGGGGTHQAQKYVRIPRRPATLVRLPRSFSSRSRPSRHGEARAPR